MCASVSVGREAEKESRNTDTAARRMCATFAVRHSHSFVGRCSLSFQFQLIENVSNIFAGPECLVSMCVRLPVCGLEL